MRYSLILLAVILALTSCESDQVASKSTEKKLIVVPEYLDVQQYDLCTLKVRLTNVPYSDVRFEWDLDGGIDNGPWYGWRVHVKFTQNKIHNVKVKAYDIFTNEFFDSASIRVDVRPPVAFVQLSPDTAIHEIQPARMNIDGSFLSGERVNFEFKFSAPSDYVDKTWDWGDGTDNVNIIGSPWEYHEYTSTGTFHAVLSAQERGGRFLGKDSSIVIIRPPKVILLDIRNALSTYVFLVVDSTDPAVVNDPLFKNPFALGFYHANANVTTDFQANDFSLLYNENSGKVCNDTISGTSSDDFRILKSLHAGVDEIRSAGQTIRYSYDLRDLELLAVTSKSIVYRSKHPIQDQFLSNLSYNALGLANPSCGTFASGTSFSVSQVPATKSGVFAVVVFNK